MVNKQQTIASAVQIAPYNRSNKQHDVMWKMQQQMDNVANEVKKAAAVMDQATRKMLNCRQLQRNPKFKAEWNISAANEFGLANGIGGRIKGTKTIKFELSPQQVI